MSNNLNSPYRTQSKRFSREGRQGFSPIPSDYPDAANMPGNDATIDIPLEQLEQVPSDGQRLRNQNSTTALRQQDTMTSTEKKGGFFRGMRKKPEFKVQGTGKKGYDGEEDTVNTMGKLYRKVAHFSVVTRYFLYVLPLGILIAVPIIIGVVAKNHATIGGVRMVWFFTWVEIVWLSLWGSKTVAHYLPAVFRVLAGMSASFLNNS